MSSSAWAARVEAVADTRALYREALSIEGCDVVDAADGRDALTKALIQPPAMVITELRLPLVSGFALCEILRRDRMTATIPIVVVTGEIRGAELEHVRRIGANDIIVKPTTPEALIRAVRRLLSVGQLSRETTTASFLPVRQARTSAWLWRSSTTDAPRRRRLRRRRR